MPLHFELVSPDKLLFSGEVNQVDLPGAEGDFGVLENHAPTVATLRPGILTVHTAAGQQRMVVLGGFAEVSVSGLTVLAEVAENVADMNRDVLTSRMSALEERIKATEPGSTLDKLITRLDHYRDVDRHLIGTAMH